MMGIYQNLHYNKVYYRGTALYSDRERNSKSADWFTVLHH